jgi:hypothetical protein
VVFHDLTNFGNHTYNHTNQYQCQTNRELNHLALLDVLNLPEGYVYVVRNRKICKRVSGGIAVIDEKELNSVLKFDIKKVSTLKNCFKIRFRFSIWMRLYPT